MADIAEYGVKIRAPEGVDQTVSGFKKIEDASKRTTSAIDRHGGAFEKSAAAMARHSNVAINFLRILGPLSGGSLELAEKMERAAVRTEKLASSMATGVTQQNVLNRAFREGSIAAATMEAATSRLSNARQAAQRIEEAYTKAVLRSQVAQQDARQAALNVREQRIATQVAQQNVKTVASVPFWDRDPGAEAKAAAELETAQRRLTRAQQEAVAMSNGLQAAQREERALKQTLSATNKELAASEKLASDASAASRTSFIGLTEFVTGLIVVLAALAVAIFAVEKAWHILKEAVGAASERQKQEFAFAELIGNADQAREKLEQLHHFWVTSGVFKFEDLAGAAKQLVLIGTGADNLIPRLEALAAVAAATDSSVTSSVAAYQRVRMAIERQTDVQMRGMGESSIQIIAIFRALMDQTGKTEAEVHRMFREGKIDIDLLNKALETSTATGGRFGSVIEDKAKIMSAAADKVRVKWEAALESLGAPIRDALTPLLGQISGALEGLNPVFEETGHRIAELITAFGSIAKDDGWREAIKAAWSVLLEEISTMIKDSLKSTFSDVAKDAANYFHPATQSFKNIYKEEIQAGESEFQAALVASIAAIQGDITGKVIYGTYQKATSWGEPNFVEQEMGNKAAQTYVDAAVSTLDRNKALLKEKIDGLFKPEPTFGDKLVAGILNPPADFNVTTAGVGARNALPKKDLATDLIGKTGKDSDWEKYKTDLQIINDYWEEYNMIQSKAATETERTRRVIELETKTAKALSNPADYIKDFTTIQGKWEAMEEARLKKAQEVDAAIKSGNASVADSFVRGIDKALESWGNFQTKVAKFAEDALNKIGDGFATALGDIVTGTKDAKTAFRDMAVSILQDISRMIIKMLVLQAIQYAIGFARGGGGGASTGALNVGASVGGYAVGGPITGASHAGGGVMINAEGGEYMIRKDVTRSEGMDKLSLLNEGKGTIVRKYDEGGEIEPPILPGAGGPTSHYQPSWMGPQPWNADAPRSVTPGGAGYEAYSRSLFADDTYNPRTMWNGTDWTNMGPVPTPGLVPDPTRNFVGFMDPATGMHLNVTGYDQNTGTTFYQDDHGNSYATGPSSPRETQPGGGQGTGTPGPAVTPYSNFGGVTSGVRDTLGNAAFDSHAAGLMEMAFQSFGGNPNNTGTTTDAGHTIFQAGGQYHGQVIDGVVTSVPGGFGAGPRDPRWVFPSQAESWRLGLSYTNNADKNNAWLIAHNPWYYGPGGVLEQQRATQAANAALPTATFSSSPVLQGPTNIGPQIPTMHSGGIVGSEGNFLYMATGGPVDEQLINARKGEGVFTRGQMAAIGAGMSGGGGNVQIHLSVDSHDTVTTGGSANGGMTSEDWKRVGQAMVKIAQNEISRQKKYRGELYVSQTGARG